jgi:hypothetical protein
VARVRHADYLTLANSRGGLPDQNAIHDNAVTSIEILQGKLMFGRHCRLDLIASPVEGHLRARLQAHQCDRDIVCRTNF